MKKKRGSGHLKKATNVRVTEYTLARAKSIADKLCMKFSDYFQLALNETNEKYEKRLECWKD